MSNSEKQEDFIQIYQYADGTFLPDSSQPNQNTDYEITSNKYTPHKSTRYMNVVIENNGEMQQKDDQSGSFINKELPELYADRGNCCGCTACYAICPEHAIVMKPDEEGFLYPVVDAEKCIRCYKCLSVCRFKEEQKTRRY